MIEIKWTFESCKEEALKYNHRKDFAKKSMTAYNKARKNKWLDQICSHMEILWEKKWTYESCKIEASKYKTRTDFCKGSGGAYDSARLNKWLDQICSDMV